MRMQGLGTVLTEDQIKSLEEAAPFALGFPYSLFGIDPALGDGQPNFFVKTAGHTKYVKASAPLKPGP